MVGCGNLINCTLITLWRGSKELELINQINVMVEKWGSLHL